MVLVLFFSIFLIFTILFFFILTGTVEYRIEKLSVSNMNKEKKLETKFISYLEFYIFSKLKIIKIKIDQDTLKKLSIKDRFKNMDFKKWKKDNLFSKENRQALKKAQINLKKFKLKLELGTENVLISTSLITIISSIISFILAITIKKYNEKQYKFQITPLYIGENKIKMEFNGIVSVKLVHIIYIIYVLNKKGEWKKNERTSNRRSYGYCHE